MLKYLIKTLVNKCVPPAPSVRDAKELLKVSNDLTAATLSLTQDEIYGSMYRDCKQLFSDAMRNKRLSREQVLYIKQMLNDFLKPYWKYYSNNHWKNDAHCIYSLMSSPFLSNKEYEKISDFVLNCIRIY